MNFTSVVCHQFLRASTEGFPAGDGLYGSSGIRLFLPLFYRTNSSQDTRSAIRARCSITQRLLSLIERIVQTSLLGTPSISRMVKTALIFSGNFERQSRITCQNSA